MTNNKRRIGVIVPDFSLGGGVPSVARFLYNAINSSNCCECELVSIATSSRDVNSVRLLSPRTWNSSCLVSEQDSEGIRYLHIGAFFTELEFQRYMPRTVLTELLNSFDLIQVVAGTPVWAYVTRGIKRPVCLFVATTTAAERATRRKETKLWKKPWLLSMTYVASRIERAILPSMEFVFAESEYTRQLLSPLVPNTKMAVGYPGIDTNLFHPDSNASKDFILSVGRFADPRKNLPLLIRAYASLCRQINPLPPLLLAGTTPPVERDWLLAKELGVERHIHYQGALSKAELARLYRNASFFVLSSNEEGLGIVLLEAMASGIPVISTRCGGPESIVKDGVNGFLVPVGDEVALAGKMQNLLQNPKAASIMGNWARCYAKEHFSLDAAAQLYLNVYNELFR